MQPTTSLARLALAPALAVFLVPVLGACGSPTKENLPAAPDAGSDQPVTSAQAQTTGSDCTTLTQTYSVCANISLCPGVTIDPYQFAGCGYSVHGDAIDPECNCYGSMCPMGAPSTCADMAAIVASTSVGAVCAQFSAGHCLNLGGQGQPSTCQQCKMNCDGILTCLQNCGC